MDGESENNKYLDHLMDWVTERLRMKDVPRLQDVYEHSQRRNYGLSRKSIAKALRMHEAYMMNMPQQRMRSRSQQYRPILTNFLGQLHADLGYFSVTRDYETPISFRHCYLVARDILSRFTYVIILRHGKSADAMVRAFAELLRQHASVHPDYPISSISFDRETSVLSHKVQSFLKENNVSFHAFQMSASKAKAAESAIKQIRSIMTRLLRDTYPHGRWWQLMPYVVNILNARPVVIDGKNTGFSPQDINTENVQQFIRKIVKAAPAYYFAQFDIAPSLAKFKFELGTRVRVKSIVISSEVLGTKRSQRNVSNEVYVIEKRRASVTRKLTLEKRYKCKEVDTGQIEYFDEDDLVGTR